MAVIGAGVAGLTAAYLLRERYDVTLFEADDRLGGHAHTHDVPTADGRMLPVDSGFIVHNDRTYPHLLRLFGELGVATRDTEMSMSVRCEGCGLEYAGGRGAAGLFPGRTAARPAYLRMLGEVRRFHRQARRLLDGGAPDDLTVGEFTSAGRYSPYFVDHFMVPLVSTVWSSGSALSLRYPAAYLFRFLDHHGLLSVSGSPRWRTVEGGSRAYVERIAKNLPSVRAATPVRAVERDAAGVTVRDEADGAHRTDRVVIAVHSDQALRLLADPTREERAVLGAIPYESNATLLHTDGSVLPVSRGARACWNYLRTGCRASGSVEQMTAVLVSYDMNRLQGHAAPSDHVVSLNSADRVRPEAVLARMTYEHPVYTPESVAARDRLPELTTGRTAYAGAYHGWGFHEDGCASGVRAAAAFGVRW